MNHKETLVLFLIACIVFTPILVCMGIKGLGALIFLWGFLAWLWWLFDGRQKLWWDKVNSGLVEGRKKKEEQEAIWNTEAPKRRAEVEKQRRAAGLVTDSSFKEFMKKKGFEVVGDIKIPEQTFEDYFYKRESKTGPSTIKIITHRSYDELKRMGIWHVGQLLGVFHKYFSYKIDNAYGGFYPTKALTYDKDFKQITVDDFNNMHVEITYYPELDKNYIIKRNQDNIVYIKKEVDSIEISQKEKEGFIKWTDENEIHDSLGKVTVSFNKYTVYKEGGVVVRKGNSQLSDNEKDFVIRGANQAKKYNTYGAF